jgi:cobalt/nickel transport system permease protein
MGVLGAFIFAAQMINFTIPGTGSSGHLGGGMILAIILGPYPAFIVMASVLTVQALFFADGGLLALGCNIWNLGIYPCFVGYPLIYKPLTKRAAGPTGIFVASLISGVVALQLGAFSVVIATMLSGRSELPFSMFVLLMQPVHLAIGLVEGFVTAGVINFVKAARPEILDSVSTRTAFCAMFRSEGFCRLLVPSAHRRVLSWFASANPDGLEWSIEGLWKAGASGTGKRDGPWTEKAQKRPLFCLTINSGQREREQAIRKPARMEALPSAKQGHL